MKKKKKHQKCLPVWWTLEYWFFSPEQKKKGLCSQYFPLSSDRAAAFLSTPSKVTACSAEASTCQMYDCFLTQRVFVAFAGFFFFFFSSNGKKLLRNPKKKKKKKKGNRSGEFSKLWLGGVFPCFLYLSSQGLQNCWGRMRLKNTDPRAERV